MCRPVTSSDTELLLNLVDSMEMFEIEQMEEVKERLYEYLSGNDQSIWLTCESDTIDGVAYCTQEPMTNGTWNLLMLLVRPNAQGKGYGSQLVSAVEDAVVARQGRLLIVETSETDGFTQAQRFYVQCGFVEVARIPDFYDAGDGKVVFCKPMH